MYKILLVDDEPLFTDFLQGLVDWGDHGCTLCGVASDGEQALRLAQQHRPDIIFLDINIPLMSGLEVCRHLRGQGIASQVVIVSAHNDFQFAQKAIQYGVSDYLLKPFDKAELVGTLHSCFPKVRAQRGDALRLCLAGQGNLPGPQVVALLRKKAEDGALQQLAEEIELACHRAGGDCRFYMAPGQATFACAVGSAEDTPLLADFFEPFARDGDVSIALGDACESVEQSYAHAKQALENRVYSPGNLVSYESLGRQTGGAMFSASDLTRLVGCLNNHDEKGITALVRKLFGLEDGHGISFQYFLSVISSLTLHMAQHYGKSRDAAEKLLAQQGTVLRDISDAADVDGMAAAIENYIYELYSDCTVVSPVTRRTGLVEKINRYIAQNYNQKGFTVEKMAAELLFENSYLRRVYKTETGNTILKALENCRIDEAKRLLQTRRHRHSEIAELTGFGDQYYFSKRFKQIVGCTPSEYEVIASNENNG